MLEKFLFKKVETWFVLILVIIGVVGALLFGWAVRHYHLGGARLGQLGPVVESFAAFPATVRDVLVGKGGKRDLITYEQRFEGQSGFLFNYAAGSRPDLGYVLVNRYDGDVEYSVSELWDLNAQEKVHVWSFSGVDDVWKQSTLETIHVNLAVKHSANHFRNLHAILDQSGSIFVGQGLLITANMCSELGLIEESAVYHHSSERDHEGNFWVPKHIEPKSVAIGTDRFLDDGIVLISPSGEVLFEKSVVEILDENGLGYLIYGKGVANEDPIHLNDIQPALVDGRYWKKGDVFLSLRHQSMIVLYRPSTNQVIWYQQGPWIHQHDVDILNDNQISIFNNNAITQNKRESTVRGVNNVIVYDFDTEEVSSPWQTGFEKLDLRTPIEGRGDIVNNEVIVEETNYGRLIQFMPDGSISWQFINRAEDGKIYRLNWSRPISRELGDQVRVSLSQRSCS